MRGHAGRERRAKRRLAAAVFILLLVPAACADDGGSADNHATLTECSGQPSTYHQAEVRIVNEGSSPADYAVVVAFVNQESGNQLNSATARATALVPGQSKVVTVRNPQLYFVGAECRIADVTRVAR